MRANRKDERRRTKRIDDGEPNAERQHKAGRMALMGPDGIRHVQGVCGNNGHELSSHKCFLKPSWHFCRAKQWLLFRRVGSTITPLAASIGSIDSALSVQSVRQANRFIKKCIICPSCIFTDAAKCQLMVVLSRSALAQESDAHLALWHSVQ